MNGGCAPDLLVAAALDALPEREELRLVRHLRGCPACRAELGQLREGAALLAFAVPQVAPRPRLLVRVLSGALRAPA